MPFIWYYGVNRLIKLVLQNLLPLIYAHARHPAITQTQSRRVTRQALNVYMADRNNCRNLARSIPLSWRARSESPKRLSGRAEGSVRKGWGGFVRDTPSIVSDAFDFSSGHPLPHPSRASFLSFSDRIPSLGLFIRRGAERETFASARQTCAKLRCRNSSMERNMVGTAEAL